MSEPRTVIPEAVTLTPGPSRWSVHLTPRDYENLIARVEQAEQALATEPDRIRAAVVKALRAAAELVEDADEFYGPGARELVKNRADAIENGADL